MRNVYILLVVALIAATTCLPTPARLSGVRNIDNGIALLPTANLTGQLAEVIYAAFAGQTRSINDSLPDFNNVERVLEQP